MAVVYVAPNLTCDSTRAVTADVGAYRNANTKHTILNQGKGTTGNTRIQSRCRIMLSHGGVLRVAVHTYILQMLPFLALIPSYLCPSACLFLCNASCTCHRPRPSPTPPELSDKGYRVHAAVLRKSGRYDLHRSHENLWPKRRKCVMLPPSLQQTP